MRGGDFTAGVQVDLLVDVVGLPVALLLVVPIACGVTKGREPVSVVETWNEVGPADYVFRVKETESPIVEAWDKLDAIQSFCFPAGSMGFVNLEPTNPKDVQSNFIHHCRSVEKMSPVNPKNLCICIRVNPVLGEGHHVRPTLHIYPVFSPAKIVCGVVDVHAIPMFKAVVADIEHVAVPCGE